MKKRDLFTGIALLSIGTILLVISLTVNINLNDLLLGYSGALILPGTVMLYKYYYWTLPKNKSVYAERLDNEKIERCDERKEHLRDKSGKITCLLGLAVIGTSIILFSILGNLGIISTYRVLILYLGGYFVFQIVSSVVIFKHLNNKY